MGKSENFYQKSAATAPRTTNPAVGAFIYRGKETPGSVAQVPLFSLSEFHWAKWMGQVIKGKNLLLVTSSAVVHSV